MSFIDKRFPLSLGRRSSGGPQRATQIVAMASGHEERNQLWADSRRNYMAGTGLRSLADIETVVAFFEEMRGRFHTFRFRDPADHKSCAVGQTPDAMDQVVGAGDGSATTFQLVKHYGATQTGWTRSISLPVLGTVKVAIDGVVLTDGFAVDASTGKISFTVPPAVGATISSGFEFDVPVRFDTDKIEIDLDAFAAGDIPDIPLVEVRV